MRSLGTKVADWAVVMLVAYFLVAMIRDGEYWWFLGTIITFLIIIGVFALLDRRWNRNYQKLRKETE